MKVILLIMVFLCAVGVFFLVFMLAGGKHVFDEFIRELDDSPNEYRPQHRYYV